MNPSPHIAIIGAGPAGLLAAEDLARSGLSVTIYDRMASPLRKFLLAGRGGLNLTHSEPPGPFMRRYGQMPDVLASALDAFPPEDLRAWAKDLGEETFVGSSGRVFPKSFKATPLARAWLRRLDELGVAFQFRHLWTGWDNTGATTFETPTGPATINADATLLALGGASWPRLGSDGTWQTILAARGVGITPLQASNVGIEIPWSDTFRQRNAGQPLKGCRFRVRESGVRGEAVITGSGLEGGAIYALSSPIRTALADGNAVLELDLKPDVAAEALATRLAAARPGETLANTLRKQAGLPPLALGLLRESTPAGDAGSAPRDPAMLADRIKRVQLPIQGLRPMERAISTAGGISFSEVDSGLQLKAVPRVWVAGEMLDWDAPTGGYLLQASFSTGLLAGRAMAETLRKRA